MSALIKKGFSPSLTRALFLFSLILPLVAVLFLFSASHICKVYGAYYSYSAGGDILYIAGEMLDALYTALTLVSLVGAVMSICAVAYRKRFLKGLAALGIFAACSLFCEGVRVGLYALLVALGVSDSTAGIGETLLPGVFNYLLTLLILIAVVLLFTGICSAVGRKKRGRGLFDSAKSVYMILIYIFIGLYGLLLVSEALPLALDFDPQKESLLAGIVLPFIYPLIYSALMLLTAFLYRNVFAGNAKKRENADEQS